MTEDSLYFSSFSTTFIHKYLYFTYHFTYFTYFTCVCELVVYICCSEVTQYNSHTHSGSKNGFMYYGHII